MLPAKYTISIGIITYNNPIEEIERNLEAIYSQQYSQNKIHIIIRNQGNYRTLEEILLLIQQKQWTNIDVYHGENIGFGAGHNDIFSRVSSDSKAYICLNPDGFLHPAALTELVNMAEYNNWHGIFEAIHEPIMHPKSFNHNTGETDWCSGACMLIPVDIYQKINGFDKDFFLYCEDVDFSWRVKAAGYKCFTCTKALFFHYAMDRKDRELEIWKSATLIAHKWRSVKFKNFALNQWKKRLDLSDIDLNEQLINVQQHTVDEVMKANPDFKNGLNFSKPMWR
ncbi:glycosyltransferase family 2 protein [Snodgrassella alvi]|uniref:glycosyltransferase family 2 protein n=1 Tax=Snodgrassella alvi TaxID=1196083 RepID=UPI0009FF5C09|nr:glycosyltransferase family 2 protein [Snodgrassella alvi]ORF35375.1 glycosyltransferase [Snodgrassella alvi]